MGCAMLPSSTGVVQDKDRRAAWVHKLEQIMSIQGDDTIMMQQTLFLNVSRIASQVNPR